MDCDHEMRGCKAWCLDWEDFCGRETVRKPARKQQEDGAEKQEVLCVGRIR
jgi:hypothetical protein